MTDDATVSDLDRRPAHARGTGPQRSAARPLVGVAHLDLIDPAGAAGRRGLDHDHAAIPVFTRHS